MISLMTNSKQIEALNPDIAAVSKLGGIHQSFQKFSGMTDLTN